MLRTFDSPKPPGWMVAASIISLGGFLNGYDTGSIGAVTTMPFFEKSFGPLSPIMRGFTISLIMITGAVPSFFASHLCDRYGQLRGVIIGSLVFIIGATLQAAASKLSMLLVGRALCGIGQGLWLSNISLYNCEIAPSAKRGMTMSIPQMATATGVCAGYFTCYGSIYLQSSIQWRLPFILEAVLAMILVISCLYLPMSPRWLLLNGRRDEALRALERLDIPRAEAEKDILRDVGPAEPKLTSWKGFLAVFQTQYRLRTILGLFVLGMVQLSGIDGVLYYAPILFSQAGLPPGTASFLASGVSAILMLLISIPAFLYADSWGRRTSILSGGVGLSFCMFVIGSLYATNSVHFNVGAGRWAVIVLIFAFALIYCATWGVAAKIYASEIQPAKTRAAANSLAQGMGFFTNWLVAFTTPIFLARSSFGAYFLFGAFSLFTVIVLFLLMPETRGRSLESIQDGFRAPALSTSVRGVRRLFTGRRRRGGNSSSSDRIAQDDLMHGGVATSSSEPAFLPPIIELTAV